jgi:hypothetical protein
MYIELVCKIQKGSEEIAIQLKDSTCRKDPEIDVSSEIVNSSHM